MFHSERKLLHTLLLVRPRPNLRHSDWCDLLLTFKDILLHSIRSNIQEKGPFCFKQRNFV